MNNELTPFVYVEASSDGDIKSYKYIKELLKSHLCNNNNVILNDNTGVMEKNVVLLFEELCSENFPYIIISINARTLTKLSDFKLQHNIRGIVQPRCHAINPRKIVVVKYANRTLCDKICEICNKLLHSKESA